MAEALHRFRLENDRIRFVADAAGVDVADPELAGFVHDLRHRMFATFQYLREEAYRRGVRDAVAAAVWDLERDKEARAVLFFRELLERLASPSARSAPPVGEADLSARHLPTHLKRLREGIG